MIKISKTNLNFLYIIPILLLITDIELQPFFRGRLNYNSSIIFFDLAAIMLTIYFGKKHTDILYKNKLNFFFFVILSVAVILPNTLFVIFNKYNLTSWLNFENIKEPILLAIRAALFEETLYRFFLFSITIYYINKIIKQNKICIFIGSIISAIFFGLSHSSFYLAFINGILLNYIYYFYGLSPTIFIHFLADVIPFAIIFLRK